MNPPKLPKFTPIVRTQIGATFMVWAVTAIFLFVLYAIVSRFIANFVHDWIDEMYEGLLSSAATGEFQPENFLSRQRLPWHPQPTEDPEQAFSTYVEALEAWQEDAEDDPALQRAIQARLFLLDELDDLPPQVTSVEVVTRLMRDETPKAWHDWFVTVVEERLEFWPIRETEESQIGFTQLKTVLEEDSGEWLDNDDLCVLLYDSQWQLQLSNLNVDSVTSNHLGFDLHVLEGQMPASFAGIRDGKWLKCVVRYSYQEESGYHLALGFEGTEVAKVLVTMQRLRNWGIPGSLVLALVVGYWLGRRIRQPIQALNQVVDQVQKGDLTARVKLWQQPESGDDLAHLANNVNQMLEQIQNLLAETQHMANNVAHDIRTPLTRIKNRVTQLSNVAQLQGADLAPLSEEIDRLLELCQALLRIAQVESEHRKEHFSNFSVDQTLAQIAELYEPLFQDVGLTFTSRCPSDLALYFGDRELIQQAVSNVLDNCLRYVSAPGQVTLSVETNDQALQIQVRDSGSGINPSELSKVTQRFYRTERHRQTTGNGLGLALVKSVCRVHGGQLELANDNGLVVTLSLPRLP